MKGRHPIKNEQGRTLGYMVGGKYIIGDAERYNEAVAVVTGKPLEPGEKIAEGQLSFDMDFPNDN